MTTQTTFHNRLTDDDSTRTGIKSLGCYSALLRKKTFSDGSIGYYLAIKKGEALTEVKLKAYQFKQLKAANVYDYSETDFRTPAIPA